MGKAKIAITLDERTVGRIDRLVRRKTYPNRSRAIEEAVEEKLDRLERSRLARESANLDPAFEKALADEGISEEIREWPEY
jgi:metal-responsive CopG/Arc/MetJ family transcriptional regulator